MNIVHSDGIPSSNLAKNFFSFCTITSFSTVLQGKINNYFFLFTNSTEVNSNSWALIIITPLPNKSYPEASHQQIWYFQCWPVEMVLLNLAAIRVSYDYTNVMRNHKYQNWHHNTNIMRQCNQSLTHEKRHDNHWTSRHFQEQLKVSASSFMNPFLSWTFQNCQSFIQKYGRYKFQYFHFYKHSKQDSL